MKEDIFNLKIGENIYQVDYDHHNGKFTEVQKLQNKSNIILCGLHTLFDKNTNNLYNLKFHQITYGGSRCSVPLNCPGNQS